MKEYKKNIYEFISNVKYMIPVILTAILGFGFVLTHSSINIDTLSYDRYFSQGMLLEQERFAAPLLQKVFRIMEFNPFFVDGLAVIFLITAAILFCALFKKISKDNIANIAYVIFSCLFISYPIMPEIFTYTPASLNICLSYCITAISLMLTYEFIENSSKKAYLISPILLCIAISLYESFAAVYLIGVFIILFLKILYSKKKFKFKEMVIYIIKFFITMILALILNFIIIKALFYILDLTKNYNANKIITYSTLGILGGIRNLLKSIINNYIVCATCYFPLTTFLLSIILIGIIGFVKSIKNKRFLIMIISLAIIISSISLSFVQGQASPYRTCQTFAVLVGFSFMIFTNDIVKSRILKNWFKIFCIFLIFVLTFFQVKDLHKWFYVNYLRYEEEKNTIISIGNEIQKYCDTNKPVVFIGTFKVSDIIMEKAYLSSSTIKGKMYIQIYNIFNKENLLIEEKKYIRKIPDSNVNSYISWGVISFEPSAEIIKWYHLLGYDFKFPTIDIYHKAIEKSTSMPCWPKDGAISEYEDYILVNLQRNN